MASARSGRSTRSKVPGPLEFGPPLIGHEYVGMNANPFADRPIRILERDSPGPTCDDTGYRPGGAGVPPGRPYGSTRPRSKRRAVVGRSVRMHGVQPTHASKLFEGLPGERRPTRLLRLELPRRRCIPDDGRSSRQPASDVPPPHQSHGVYARCASFSVMSRTTATRWLLVQKDRVVSDLDGKS